jgi:hypothetical protein
MSHTTFRWAATGGGLSIHKLTMPSTPRRYLAGPTTSVPSVYSGGGTAWAQPYQDPPEVRDLSLDEPTKKVRRRDPRREFAARAPPVAIEDEFFSRRARGPRVHRGGSST